MRLPCPLEVLLSPPWPRVGHPALPCQRSVPAQEALGGGTKPSWGLKARTLLAGNSGLHITHSLRKMTECYLWAAQCAENRGCAVMRKAGDFALREETGDDKDGTVGISFLVTEVNCNHDTQFTDGKTVA